MRVSPLAAIVLALTTLIAGAGCDGDSDSDSDASATTQVETIAGGSVGDGRRATEVPLAASNVATDRHGNIYVNDHARLRRIDPVTGRIYTIAGGDDPERCRYTIGARPACLQVSALAVDPKDRVYATHSYESTIVRIEPATGAITLVARTSRPAAITTDPIGNVFVNDVDDARIFRIDAGTGVITTAAGNGDGESTAAECPRDVPATATCVGRSVSLAADRDGGLLISGDAFPFLRRVDPDSGILSAIPVPNGRVAVDADNTFVVSLPAEDRVVRADPTTGAVTTLRSGTRDDPLAPGDVAVDPHGRTLVLTGDHRLLRLDRAGGAPDVVAGNGSAEDCGDGGPAPAACLGRVADLDVAPNGDVVIAQRSGPIRVIDADDGDITTLADLSDSAVPACGVPSRVAVGPTGDAFVAGFFFAGCRIDHRTGAVSLVAGGTSCDGFGNPAPRDGDLAVGACLFFTDVLVDADGGLLIADNYKPRIWRVDPATGRLAVVAGTGGSGPCVGAIGDGGDARAACVSPFRLGRDGAGNLYVLDDLSLGDGTRVRRIDAVTGIITTVAGMGVVGDCGDGGPAVAACLAARNLLVDADGNLFLGGGTGVRKVDAATGMITTVYRDDTSRFDVSLDALDRAGRLLFFTDDTAPRVRRLTLPRTPPVPEPTDRTIHG